MRVWHLSTMSPDHPTIHGTMGWYGGMFLSICASRWSLMLRNCPRHLRTARSTWALDVDTRTFDSIIEVRVCFLAAMARFQAIMESFWSVMRDISTPRHLAS